MQTAFGVPPPVFNFILISLRRQTASGCGSPGGGCAGAQVPPCPRRCPFQPPLGRVGSRLELLLGVTREEPRCVRPLPEAPQPRLPGGQWPGSMPPSPPWGVRPPGLQPRGPLRSRTRSSPWCPHCPPTCRRLWGHRVLPFWLTARVPVTDSLRGRTPAAGVTGTSRQPGTSGFDCCGLAEGLADLPVWPRSASLPGVSLCPCAGRRPRP